MADTSFRISQKRETTAAIRQPQLELFSDIEPTDISDDHPMQAGPTDGYNIRLGKDVIQALNNGVPVTIRLQPLGGGVGVIGDIAVVGNLELTGSLKASTIVSDGTSNRTIGAVSNGTSGSTFSGIEWMASNSKIPELGLSFIAPPSGSVSFFLSAKLSTGSAGVRIFAGLELHEEDVDGAVIIPPLPLRSVETASEYIVTGQWTHGTSVLTPGSSYYVRFMQRMADDTTTGTVWARNLTVAPRL